MGRRRHRRFTPWQLIPATTEAGTCPVRIVFRSAMAMVVRRMYRHHHRWTAATMIVEGTHRRRIISRERTAMAAVETPHLQFSTRQ
jgi:hypothetical protein